MDIDRRVRTNALADQAQALIERFRVSETEDPESSWETLIEMKAVIAQLSGLCPPKVFRYSAK